MERPPTTPFRDSGCESLGVLCVSRVIQCLRMAKVTIRELRNHGGTVVERVRAGERLTVTRSGRPVAELRPLPRRGPGAQELLSRWRNLPHVDPAALRSDIDAVIDPSL